VIPRVDLHLHTIASDGRCSPAELVERSAMAGLSVIAVTDHDTTAAIEETQRLGRERDIEVISGIELTSVTDGRDVHMLGYFFDPDDTALLSFLLRQRHARVERVKAVCERLSALGVPIELDSLLKRAEDATGRSIGRPQIARAMIEAGHVTSTREAFDRWLAHGAPAFVPRSGPSPADSIAVLHDAGAIVSVAHPGADQLQEEIPRLAAAGLDAIEAFHSDHDSATVDQLRALAARLNLLTTGGSDFHGMPEHGLEPGSVLLPPGEWDRLRTAASARSPSRQ
jgi:predicted metal-dependent phosphoesterase TrpH